MKLQIITISREFGSGGRTIGKKVAEQLQIAYYDEEIVSEIAKESGLAESFVKEQGEYANTSSHFLFNFNNWGNGMTSTLSDRLYVLQRNLICELAEKGPCVIVGRCADYVLRERRDCLNVFVHANMEFRADRIVRLYGEKEDAPQKRLEEKDKKRSTYYKYYTNRTWGKAQNYHLCLDSGMLGVEHCVQIICEVVNEKNK